MKHRELGSGLCGDLNGKEIQTRGDACIHMGFPGILVAKNLPASAGDAGDMGSIPGSGRSPRGGNGHPLWYSCLENPIDRGAW